MRGQAVWSQESIIHSLHEKPFGMLRTKSMLPEGPCPFMALKMWYMTKM